MLVLAKDGLYFWADWWIHHCIPEVVAYKLSQLIRHKGKLLIHLTVSNSSSHLMSKTKRKFAYDLIREECRQSHSVECPICRDDVTEGLTILKPCGHVFCRPCISIWNERVVKSPTAKCPLCWQVMQELTHFNSVTFASLAPYRHDKCGFLCGIDDTSKSFIYSLSKEWLRLVRFMFKTHSDPSNFQGVKGIEHLNLRSVKDDAILSKGKGHIGYTKCSEDYLAGRLGLVICTLLPNLSVMIDKRR